MPIWQMRNIPHFFYWLLIKSSSCFPLILANFAGCFLFFVFLCTKSSGSYCHSEGEEEASQQRPGGKRLHGENSRN